MIVPKIVKYGAVLIGLYIATAYGTNFGGLIDKGSEGSAKVIKAFQGRN